MNIILLLLIKLSFNSFYRSCTILSLSIIVCKLALRISNFSYSTCWTILFCKLVIECSFYIKFSVWLLLKFRYGDYELLESDFVSPFGVLDSPIELILARVLSRLTPRPVNGLKELYCGSRIFRVLYCCS